MLHSVGSAGRSSDVAGVWDVEWIKSLCIDKQYNYTYWRWVHACPTALHACCVAHLRARPTLPRAPPLLTFTSRRCRLQACQQRPRWRRRQGRRAVHRQHCHPGGRCLLPPALSSRGGPTGRAARQADACVLSTHAHAARAAARPPAGPGILRRLCVAARPLSPFRFIKPSTGPFCVVLAVCAHPAAVPPRPPGGVCLRHRHALLHLLPAAQASREGTPVLWPCIRVPC